jgi:TolB-like protein/Tfp pilus assembly protein PilF
VTTLAPHRVTLCVLPFDDLACGGDYYVRGFVADLVADFSRFSELAVVAWTATAGATPPRADYLLRGTLRRDGAQLRVSVELLDGGAGSVVWADRLEQAGVGVFAIQDEICARVVAIVSERIRATLTAAARRKPTRDHLAYDFWLRGMDELKRGTLKADDDARTLFRAALEQDPTYARAYVGLSLSHFNEWTCQFWQHWDYNERHAYDYAQRALELDQADHWCQLVLGRILLFRREFERAEQHLTRALLLNGNDADALVQLSMAMAFLDRKELAATLFERALSRNPFHEPWYYAYGLASAFVNEHYSELLARARRVPPNIMVDLPAYAAAAHCLLGDTATARDELERYLRQFEEKIARGRDNEPGEALRWLQQTNPYRCKHTEERLLTAVRAAAAGKSPIPTPVAEAPALCVFRQVGSLWQATFAGVSAWLPSCKGFGDLKVLLEVPGREIHCGELMGVVDSASDTEALDDAAREQYTERIRSLEGELSAGSKPAALEPIYSELAALRAHLSSGVGLGGRSRKLAAPGERARSAVTQRIKSALKRITEIHPTLGEHLQRSLRTGTFCVYAPSEPVIWQL